MKKRKMQTCNFLDTYGFNAQLFGGEDWTPPTKEEWLKTTRDLHFFKSENGELKKDIKTKDSKIKELEDGQGNDYAELEGKYNTLVEEHKTLKSDKRASTLKYEGLAGGLKEEDIKEIQVSEDATLEDIQKAVKDKKASIDKRVEEYLKDKGMSTSILSGTKGKGGETEIEQYVDNIYDKGGKKGEKKDYYNIP